MVKQAIFGVCSAIELETCLVTVQNVPTTVSVPADTLTEWELYPPYYYRASSFLSNFLYSSNHQITSNVGGIDGSIESVVASVYIVQFARLLEHEGTYTLQAAESPASTNDLPLWKFEDITETIPTKDQDLAISGQKAIQVEELDLKLVASKGHAIHSGELKVYLVDTKGGGLLSPREVELFLADNLHVELVGISGQDCVDLSEAKY
ncbi:Hypothetical predicted protein [Olea europaea subsp. europaea]|uniref:Uncharacterized protein n=1 Tax=Olea europaea subsp. europaea TaxID=158383 RepID=A0A8S0QN66_OLEEU|nr:Hypothetical predicted protein [Olea europaea subsp. europaea]